MSKKTEDEANSPLVSANKKLRLAEEKLKWLQNCDMVNRSGQDGGWTFRFLAYEPEEGVPPMDITISIRGFGTLSDAVEAAMNQQRNGKF